jgi:hypothetical protein
VPTKQSSQAEPSDWHRFTVALSQDDAETMRRIAASRGSKLAIVVREAVLFWLDAQRRKARAS